MKAGEGRGVHGEGPLPGRRRKPRRRELVAARVAQFRCECPAPAPVEGVTVLNAGFVELERMRTRTVAKARLKKAKKVRGR
jgi:hypothetical protein